MGNSIWLIWAANLLAQNFAFTFVSRARNSGSLKRHIIAAVCSNAIWIAQFQILIGPMMDYLSGKRGLLLQVAVGAFYVAFTVGGSILAHFWALKTEKGNSAVGANKSRAEITPEQWEAMQCAVGARVVAEELIDFAIQKYDVKSLEGFTCPIYRRLAASLGKFER